MKNKFTAGIITGCLCTLLLCTAAFSVFLIKDQYDKQPLAMEQSKQPATSEKFEDNAQLLEKMDYMKKIVSSNFLYDVTEEEYSDGILKGMMQALDDPYSCYYTSEEYAEVTEKISGTYCGIGSYVGQDRNSLIMTITRPFPNGPADKAGIEAGDIIYKVNDEDVTGMDINSVVAKMRGEKGTDVKLTILRGEKLEEKSFVIVRDDVEVPTVSYEKLEDDMGYIYIAQFDTITVKQFNEAVDELSKQKVKGLIIDIRDNGGGSYDACISMLDRLIGKGLLVYTETKNGLKKEEFAKTKEKYDKPIVVLVNGNSASASEIFAGAIQDYQVGTIVGTQTFGKGIVQSVIPLGDGSAMKLTILNYFTPKGRSIHKVGITPDVKVELNPELKGLVERKDDNQLQTAVETLQKLIDQK